MALPNEMQKFRLYVTHVDGEGPFLRISGQLDKQSACMIESLIESSCENFENGIGAVPPVAVREGVICAAKYKDGTYYRAKIINTTNLSNGLVGVHFIDYGNKDIISLSTIRFLDRYDPLLLQLRGQSTDYYLSCIMHPCTKWEEPAILKLQSLLCYSEYPAVVEAQSKTLPIISIQFQGNDLSEHLVANKYGAAVPLAKQEQLLTLTQSGPLSLANWPQSYPPDNAIFTDHVPFLNNQQFPSNPASAMRLQNVALPYNGGYAAPPHSAISQRLLVNKTRTPISLRAPFRQPQGAGVSPVTSPAQGMTTPPPLIAKQPLASQPVSPKKASKTYKSRLLEVNSQHKVFVSYAEEGPELFAVQLVTDAKRLQDMMDDINRRPHRSLTEPPMIGTVCLGRMSGDRIICRAIVMNLSGSQCKLFFVDFGDTEMVSYYDIFDIPEEFVKPNVFAMRFCLSGVKNLSKGPHLNETFKQLVNGKVLTLKVVSPEGPPLIQYGEIHIDNKNVLDLLMNNVKDSLQFKWLNMFPRGSKHSVLVSYVDSCLKFYVQPSTSIDDLNAVMDNVKAHCENSTSPGELPVGAACCARFPDDGNWYRAIVRSVNGKRAVVAYVDYGNEQGVDVSDLRTITNDLIHLPAQAMKCALKGYEDKQIDTKTSNQLEMLALEKTLLAHVVGVLSNDTMLVSLVDDTVSPPLDVARKMMQLSQPRNMEPKPATPNRKDGPEPTFSSPEGSVGEDRRGFRREKSFKDDRRPPREDGFGQRGSSFRGKENREGFDRSGPGRHSDKFGGRPDRPERGDRPDRGDRDRRGNKPWENGPSAADDDWEETSPPNNFQPPAQNKSFRDSKRKPRNEQQQSDRPKPNFKGKDNGPGKRLRQAVEGAEAHNQQKFSIQDRLRRDNYKQHDDRGEKKNDDWDNRQNRPDRRDNRFERKDGFGEKRDGYQKREFNDRGGDKPFQKREFRDRNDRPPRSNFSPRDRAERSFGSEKSDRSFKSDGRTRGNVPPFKSRGNFTQVQYKELPNPVDISKQFTEPSVDPNAQHEVSVTWIISPDSFYTQILSHQPKFLEMMHRIPEIYKGVKPFTGVVPVGASVLAKYPEDGVLYRATIVSVQPFGKFIVQYIDFGNKFVVDARDIWQLDQELMELPKMAVHCTLIGVMPKDGEWKANNDIDLCFNAPRYQCVFQECVEGKYKVSLWNNGVSVADMLVEKELAAGSEQTSSVTLKDEAIDLTIIVGQQFLCKVTAVESYDSFYVQLDLDKAACVEAAIANYDTSLLTPLSADSLSDGVHCTVKYQDKIYRAILTDISDTANIKAVLPDYGINITTTMDKLMILPTELTVYYYQSLNCTLHNFTEESNKLMTIEQLKETLTDKKCIVYVNDVDGIKLVTTLYDLESGKKLSIFEPDELAYEQVTQMCLRAVFNYNFGLAFVSHIERLNEVYLQKSTDGDRLAVLLDELYKFYEEGNPEVLSCFETETMCAAKSSDGNWYRGTITTSTETECTIHFSDYGNSETVSKESVKVLDAKFFEPCALALVVSLGVESTDETAVNKLKEWTHEQEVQVTLSFGTDGWLAVLHLDGLDLTMKLVNENLATASATNEQPEEKAVENANEFVSLPEGCTEVYISHIDSPGQFWLQMSDKINQIEEIQAELQEKAANLSNVENREMGTVCIAKYSADDLWYRAQILDSDSDITTVRFIDYGNTDVLDNQPGLLKVIPDNLKETEGFAVKSSVNAVPTGTGQWSEPASEYFTKLVGDISSPVDALIVLKDVTTYVDIFVNGQNLTDKLVSEGHATRSEDNECGDLPSCFASHVNSPSEFWIQLETATPELQAMENAMVDAENFPELTDKEEGVLCAAKYPEDGAWYRAQVIVDGSEGTEVLFMDYGNASIAKELRSLPDDLKIKPALSRKCALQKPRDIKSWSRKSEQKFNELAAEGATIFNVQFIASGDISIVELYLDGKSVTEDLVALSEQVPDVERPIPVGQDLKSNGKICLVNSIDEFYVHFDESTTNRAKILERLIDAPEFEAAPELKVGSVCAAFWAEDEQWYRARILEFCDIGSHVQFIDYGNKSKCEDFRQLPEDLVTIEPLAKCCRLAGLTEELRQSEKTKSKFDEIASENSTFQIEILDSTSEPVLVKITLQGEDLASMISSGENTEAKLDVSHEQVENTVSEEAPSEISVVPSTVTDKDVELDTRTEENKAEPAPSETKPDIVVDQSEPKTGGNESQSEQTELKSEANESQSREVKELDTEATRDESDSLQKPEDDQTEVETSELNESIESNNTVIENKSFESTNSLNDKDSVKSEENIAEKDLSTDTLENSAETIKTPERDESKDSINTDTGYTSGPEAEKSITVDAKVLDDKEKSPIKGSESPKEEVVNKTEDTPVA